MRLPEEGLSSHRNDKHGPAPGEDKAMKAAAPSEAGRLTTHVLDAASGRPASGVGVEHFRSAPAGRDAVREAFSHDGARRDAPMLSREEL